MPAPCFARSVLLQQVWLQLCVTATGVAATGVAAKGCGRVGFEKGVQMIRIYCNNPRVQMMLCSINVQPGSCVQ